MRTPAARHHQEHVLGGDPGLEPTEQVVPNGGADHEPRLPRHHCVYKVRASYRDRRAVECASTTCVRVAIDEHSARNRIAPLGHYDMGDALISSDIMQPLDPESRSELAPTSVGVCGRSIICRHEVVENYHHPAGIADLDDVVPAFFCSPTGLEC